MENLEKLRSIPTLTIVVPCYNEEEAIAKTLLQLLALLKTLIADSLIKSDSFIYIVDDGSSDNTWKIVSTFHASDPHIKGLQFSRNFGHQGALLAGLLANKDKVDCAISIDGDLQQDIAAIPEFIKKYREGADIVFGIRRDREADGFFKKYTALFFYKFMQLMGVKIIKNHPDYRLTSRQVLQTLAEYNETNLFLRSLFVDLGFKTAEVYYDSRERVLGQSKYSLRKMISFAINGITSFSITPLRFIAVTGFIILLFSFVSIFYVLLEKLFFGGTVPGWASVTLPIYFLGGVQIFCIGLIGEYIGKIYQETKRRPRFIKKDELR